MSSEYAAVLNEAKKTAPVWIANFLQSSFDENTVVAFVEGNDDIAFFNGFLSKHSPNNDVLFINCENKAGVIHALKRFVKLAPSRTSKSMLFLCDRDFDDFIEHAVVDNLYRTNYYSIENHLVSIEYFDYILGKFCGKTRKRERRSLASDLLNKVRKHSKDFLGLFAVMCIERQIISKAKFDDYKLELNFLYCRNTESYACNASIEQLMEEFGISIDYMDIVFEVQKKMAKSDFQTWMRGKQALRVVRIILKLIDDFENKNAFIAKLSRSGLPEYANAVLKIQSLDDYCLERTRAES
jgi:hypothetical protein